ENPYPPPQSVIDEIKQAIDGTIRLYPDPTAKELRKLISSVYLARFRTLYQANNILVANGSDEILDILFKTFIDPGDEVVIFKPSYGMYTVLADLYQAKKNVIPLTETFDIPESAKNATGKLMLICSPNNPDGKSVDNDTIEAICSNFEGLVIVDEAYADFSDKSAIPLLRKHKNLCVMRTFSKGYSLAGLRVGFLVADTQIIKVLNETKLPYNVNTVSQIAASIVINHIKEFEPIHELIKNERTRVINEILNKYNVNIAHSDANFILIKFEDQTKAMKIFWELKDNKVLTRQYNQKGMYQYIRLTIGTQEQNDRFLEVFDKLAEKYQIKK
ncbi:MAG: histidinol-phosphate transaminase, partial [Promethearchaeota archaeon]